MSTEGHDPRNGSAPAWTAGTVARRLGVAQSTLRSWNRRYGLGPEGHQPGRYRHYTEDDIAVLEAMRRMVADGMPPSSAAAFARQQRSAGNDVARLRRSARGVESAALQLDTDTVLRSLHAGFRRDGVLRTWHRLCRPALMRIGRRVTDRGDCIDVELMLSWAVITSLHRTHEPLTSSGGEPVLLACAAGEQHSLGLEVLRAALAEQGISARMLGPSVPTAALVDAVRRTRPAAVVLSSQVPRTAGVAALRKARRAAGHVIAAGPGWTRSGLPPDVVHGGTIEQVLDAVHTAVRSEMAAG